MHPTQNLRHITQPKILNILIEMENNGLSNYTIKYVDKALTYISRYADLNEPEQVKRFIANKNTTTGYKKALCMAYNKYCKRYQIQWNIPTYTRQNKPIKIPTQEKLQMLIASTGPILSAKLQISKETGIRPIELHNLKVKDIDLEKRLIYPTTAKHGASRTLKISNSLRDTLQNHISRNKLNLNDKLFKGDATHYGNNYREMRNRLANKLHDPSLRTIRLYDFRHYFATNLYAKTRDILLVKQQMGHKQINTTMIYTQLLDYNEDEWTVKTANNIKEATDLLEAGFTYIQDIDGIKLYRKRK